MSFVRSKKRVADHGEVFTPRWLVEDMLNLVQSETERIDSRFLEPACGSGNFLLPVLERKLETVQIKFGKSTFEKEHHALFGLMCIYGIELLGDNAEECRNSLLETFIRFLNADTDKPVIKAAANVLRHNIIQGDAIKMLSSSNQPIVIPEWSYAGKGLYHRSDFLYNTLTQRSSIQGTLFEQFEETEIFTPMKTYPTMTLKKIAELGSIN